MSKNDNTQSRLFPAHLLPEGALHAAMSASSKTMRISAAGVASGPLVDELMRTSPTAAAALVATAARIQQGRADMAGVLFSVPDLDTLPTARQEWEQNTQGQGSSAAPRASGPTVAYADIYAARARQMTGA